MQDDIPCQRPCRNILSDAWYKKVIRHWRAALVKEFHAEDGAEVVI